MTQHHTTSFSQTTPWWIGAKRLLSKATRNKSMYGVEFLLVAPLVLVFIVGAYDLSTIIKDKWSLQNVTKAGLQYGMANRPDQSGLSQVENAVKASFPDNWLTSKAPYSAKVTATIQCVCSQTGIIACNSSCPSGESRISYLGIEVSKRSKFLFQYPGLGESIDLYDKSLVRLP